MHLWATQCRQASVTKNLSIGHWSQASGKTSIIGSALLTGSVNAIFDASTIFNPTVSPSAILMRFFSTARSLCTQQRTRGLSSVTTL